MSEFGEYEPGAALLVAAKGRVLYNRGFGLADLQDGRPIQSDTPFLIGSVTKQFTAAAVLKLVGEKKLALEDPLLRHFPSFSAYEKDIRLHHLLTHTSGIKEYLGDVFWEAAAKRPKDLNQEDVLTMIYGDLELDFPPGTDWKYSNSGYVILGSLVAKVSGCSFGQYLKENFFVPLGMKDTTAPASLGEAAENTAKGYEKDGLGFRPTPFHMGTVGWGDGNIISTTEDLHRWKEAFFSNRLPVETSLLKKAITSARLTNGQKTQYGYGWYIGRRRGLKEIWHSGGTLGFTARASFFPKADVTMILLANRQNAPLDLLLGDLADVFLHENF